MKQKSKLRPLHYIVCGSLFAINLASAQTTYFWDVNGATSGTGGTGDWNTLDNSWRSVSDTGTLGAWVNAEAAPFNNATFGGTVGTVTLTAPIALRNLAFTNTAGAYTITGNTLNFTGGTITGPVSSAIESAIIQSNITGAPAINLQPMAGDRQFTLRPAVNGSMIIGAVTGDGGNGSEKLNLQGGAGSTGTIASVTGPKVIVTGGSWTINGASSGRNHDILGGTLTLNANLNATNRAVILGSTGTLNYNVASAVSASAANATSGDNGFRITGGTLDNTSGAAINTNAGTTTIDLAGTLTFAGTNGANSNLNLGTGAVFLKGGNRQITVTNAATTLTIGGVIQNDSSPTVARGLTKAGAGTLLLSGNSSYTGATNVSVGTLRMNGSTHSSSAFTVASGATLAGTGTVRGTVAVSGNIAPGNGTVAIGTLNTGATTWNGGSNLFQFDLSNTSTSSDRLAITGNFTKGTDSTFQFDFLGAAPTASRTYDLITWTGTTDFTSSNFSFTGLGGLYTSGAGFTITGNTLQFTAVPEASNLLIGGLLGLGLMSRRRKNA